MDAKLNAQFERMEQYRVRLFELLRSVDERQLSDPPKEGKWSVLQILHHLMNSEQMSATYVLKKVQAGEGLAKAGLGESIRSSLLRFILRLPLKFKAPGVAARVPEAPDAASTLDAYENVRTQFREMLNSIPPDMAKRKIYRHPLAGRMDLYQAMGFLVEHYRHHEKQIRRILRQ